MDPELLELLRRRLPMGAPADATRTPAPPPQPTIGPQTRSAVPAPKPGPLAALLRSAQPSEDTPGGMLNELLNPVRAGFQARQLADEAIANLRGGDVTGALGAGALSAMSVPVGPRLRPRISPSRQIPISPVDIANAQNPNLQNFLGRSVAQTEEGIPLRLVHGTNKVQDGGDFTSFRYSSDPYQLGIHVALDPRQADSITGILGGDVNLFDMLADPSALRPKSIRHLLNAMPPEEYSRSLPLYGRFENPLRMPDVGAWGPSNILAGLIRTGQTDIADRLRPAMFELDLFNRFRNAPTSRPDATLRRLLRDEGYDSIVYRNRYEGLPTDLLTPDRLMLPEPEWQARFPDQQDTFIALDRNQLKSALGNVGTYDRRTADLMRALALLTGGGAMALNAEDGEDALGGATLAGLGLLTGRPNRAAWQAWHGSPVRGITRFDPNLTSPGVIAGKGTYVAGDDVFGAGRQQATGYIGGPLSFMNVQGMPGLIGDPRLIDRLENMGYSRPAGQTATDAYYSMVPNVPLSRKTMTDPEWEQYSGQLREAWLDRLSRFAERAPNERGVRAAQEAAQAVQRGDIGPNRGALYNLSVDADRARMLDRDASIMEQSEPVARAIADIKQLLGYRGSAMTGGGFLHDLEYRAGSPDEAMNLLLERGVEGVKAGGGDYPVSRAALQAGGATPEMLRDKMAPSTQYTIFNPERIKILQMLTGLGMVGGAAAAGRPNEEMP